MKKPKVVLKNIKTFEGHEGYGLNVDVYINGIYCMTAIDDGNGGDMDFRPNYDEKTKGIVTANVQALEEYIKTLPDEVLEFKTGSTLTVKPDMESYINNLLLEMEDAKNKRKMEKLYKTAIVLGVPDASTYSFVKCKRELNTIPQMVLQNSVNNVIKKYCIDGVVIFNTNLDELGIEVNYRLGLNMKV